VIAFTVKFSKSQQMNVGCVSVQNERKKFTTKKHTGKIKKSVMSLKIWPLKIASLQF
jgi:azurin